MSRKKEIILESIKKLIALNVSDREIILNLRDVGIESEEAKQLLAEAKKKPIAEKEIKQKADSGKVMRDVAETLATTAVPKDQLTEINKDQSKTDLIEANKEEKKIPSLTPLISSAQSKEDVHVHANLSKLWEKGILTTVDQKLEEMKKIKKEVDNQLEEKISEAITLETDKVRILFESQKTLLTSKVETELEDKAKEIESVVDSKVSELKELNKEIKENIAEMELKREEQKKVVAEFESKLEELRTVKQELVTDMNSELIKSKSQAQEFLDNAEKKMGEIDSRVSRTLELESKIAEGLIKDAQDKIDEISLEKSEELSVKVGAAIAELKGIEDQVEPEKIRKLVSRLEQLEKSLDNRYAHKIEEMKTGISEYIEQSISKKMEETKKDAAELFTLYRKKTDKEIKKSEAGLEAVKTRIEKGIDIEKLSTATEELDAFKEQFIKVIEQNVSKYNEAISKVNEQAKQVDGQVNSRIAKIDKKIEELDAFEKAFAEEMGIAIEKIELKKKKGKKK